MRLLEIAPNFVMNQTATLMTILQHLKSKMGTGTKVPISAVSNLMRNVGYNFNYDNLKQMYDSNPALQKVISNFNQEEMTIGDDGDDMTGQQEVDGDKKVDQMAQSAAQTQLAK